jgi:hypothetical protein
MNMSKTIGLVVLAGAAAIGTLGGCTQYGPRGDAGGIVNSDERIRGTNRDPAASAEELLIFSDQVAKGAAERISDTREITDRSTKAVITIGEITNRSNTSRSDLATIRRRMFLSLMKTPATQYAIFRERRDQVDSIYNAEKPRQNPDLLDERTQEKYQPPQYDPNDLYVLNVEFGELNRGGSVTGGRVSTYVADATLMHVGTGQIVFAEQYDFKQVR